MQTLTVRVKPRSRASELTSLPDGSFEARLTAPPVDGKANAELIALIAAHFGCAKANVSIKSGAGSRVKRVNVDV